MKLKDIFDTDNIMVISFALILVLILIMPCYMTYKLGYDSGYREASNLEYDEAYRKGYEDAFLDGQEYINNVMEENND